MPTQPLAHPLCPSSSNKSRKPFLNNALRLSLHLGTDENLRSQIFRTQTSRRTPVGAVGEWNENTYPPHQKESES